MTDKPSLSHASAGWSQSGSSNLIQGSRSIHFDVRAVNLVLIARAGDGASCYRRVDKGAIVHANSDLDLGRKPPVEIPMSDPTQPDVLDLDRMIARLEEANARCYNGPSCVGEPSSKSVHGDRHESPSQPAASKQRMSWARRWSVAVILLVIAASAYGATVASELFDANAVKLRIARWVLSAASQTTEGGAVSAVQNSREMEPRLQRMTDELAGLQQQIEQLKVSQDLVRRSGVEAAAQIKIDREQTARDSANVVDQLRITQEQLTATQAQLAEIVSSEPTNSGRKFSRRKHLSALSRRARARDSAR